MYYKSKVINKSSCNDVIFYLPVLEERYKKFQQKIGKS